jgi:PAS domain S-box-containing protein
MKNRNGQAAGEQLTAEEIARQVQELETQNEELKRSRAMADALLAQYTELYDFTPAGYLTLDREGAIRQLNFGCARLLGFERSLLENRHFSQFIAESDRRVFSGFLDRVFASGAQESCEVSLTQEGSPPLAVQIEGKLSADGKACRAAMLDITELKRSEKLLSLQTEVLEVINSDIPLERIVAQVVAAIKQEAEFDAVGLRLKVESDYPFVASIGYSEDFLKAENALTNRNPNGGLCRNEDGTISLDCTCGMIVSGKFDPANPFFTPGGSAWTNNALPLLDIPPAEDPRLHPRNRCIHVGFLSLALIPIRAGGEILGLLHLADRRQGRFNIEAIHLFEGIGISIGVALARKQAEEALLLKNFVFDVSTVANSISDMNGAITDVNQAFLRTWGYPTKAEVIGKTIPDFLNDDDEALAILAALNENGRWEGDYAAKRKDGSTFIAHGLATMVQDEQGRAIAYQSAVTDVTAQRETEAELQRQLQELQRWHAVTVDRTERNRELKKEVNDLLMELGRPPKYGGQAQPGGH